MDRGTVHGGPAIGGSGPAYRLQARVGMRVLLVEDDDRVALGVGRLLGAMGVGHARVRTAEDARALLDGEEFEAAIVDLGHNGGQPGLELLDWLRANRAGIRRVLISGGSRPAAFHDDPPSQVFLAKPFGWAELERVLQ
jgi:DNA-binding NtrC family response regulator